MWQKKLLKEIQQIDSEQKPHGLYSLPDLLRDGHRLQPFSRIFGGNLFGDAVKPELDLIQRLGWNTRYAKQERLEFVIPEQYHIHIEIHSHASTKVRRYGDSHHLDKIYGKPITQTSREIEKRIPKIRKRDFIGDYTEEYKQMLEMLTPDQIGLPNIWCDLLIAYFPKKKDYDTYLGKGSDVDFCSKYGLRVDSLVWKDTFARDFWTGLYIWTYRSKRALALEQQV